MTGSDGNVKGAQTHAEGQHGERTHARFQEQLRESTNSKGENDSARRGDDTSRDSQEDEGNEPGGNRKRG